MNQGIAQSKPQIEEFKKLLKQGRLPPNGDRDLFAWARARTMWNHNELHFRPEWYMLHHGEGGFYKMGMAQAGARNLAMTLELVSKAAALYASGAHEAGLSVLSDALHQAEDRGSHQEGAEFLGHDIRQTIDISLVSKYNGGAWDPLFKTPPPGHI